MRELGKWKLGTFRHSVIASAYVFALGRQLWAMLEKKKEGEIEKDVVTSRRCFLLFFLSPFHQSTGCSAKKRDSFSGGGVRDTTGSDLGDDCEALNDANELCQHAARTKKRIRRI